MPRSYPPEYRRRVLDLIESGKSVAEVAAGLEVTDQTIYNWWNQHLVDTGRKPGATSTDNAELVAAGRRIDEFETQFAATKRANELLKEVVSPKGRFDAVETMASKGYPVEVAAEACGVSVSGTFREVDPPCPVHRPDHRCPHRLPWRLRVTTCPCRAHARMRPDCRA
jgi:transposase-like protein